jgi:hypothetical protein
MNPAQGNDYTKWSLDELRKAESVAQKFLTDNGPQIWENFCRKLEALDVLVTCLKNKNITLDQRLDCFARIAEISQAMKDDAEGFFELASEPVVARILSNVRSKL